MDQTYTVTLSVQQLQVISAALAEAPWKFANPLIEHINSEIQKQQAGTSGLLVPTH